jgi:purine-nucleoside phosphorylase
MPEEHQETPFDAAVEAIKSKLPERLQNPRVGIVCGSGLGGIVDCIRDLVLVPYSTIPGFVESTGEHGVRTGLALF